MSKYHRLAATLCLFSTGALPIASTAVLAQGQTAKTTNSNPAKASTAQAEKTVQSIFDNMIGAVEDNSYTNFHAFGDADFKEQLTKDLFGTMADQVSPRLNKGYTAEYLGSLNQRGFKAHLWKLTFKDSGDDMLCNISIKAGKVGGFFIL